MLITYDYMAYAENKFNFSFPNSLNFDRYHAFSPTIKEIVDTMKCIKGKGDLESFLSYKLYKKDRKYTYNNFNDVIKAGVIGWFDLSSTIFSGRITKSYFDYVDFKTPKNLTPEFILNNLIILENDVNNFIQDKMIKLIEYFRKINFSNRQEEIVYNMRLIREESIKFLCFIHHIVFFHEYYENYDIFISLFKNSTLFDKNEFVVYDDLNVLFEYLNNKITNDNMETLIYSKYLKLNRNINSLNDKSYITSKQSYYTTITDGITKHTINKEILSDLFIDPISFGLNRYEEDDFVVSRRLTVIISIISLMYLDLNICSIIRNNKSLNVIDSYMVSKYSFLNPLLYTQNDIKTLWENIFDNELN